MDSLPDLTVKERTLIHLYHNRVPDWEMDLPEKLTQKGIAKKVGVSRAHISQTLISLEKEGYVKSKKSRIKGQKRRKKVYSLQESGRKEAEKLYNSLMEKKIELIIDGGSEKYEYRTALDKCDLSFLEIYNIIKEDGKLIISEALEEIEEEKQEREEIGEIEEQIPEKKASFVVPIFSFIFLGVFAALNMVNIYYLNDETLLCFYPFGFLTGLIPISYFFYVNENRYRSIEQTFSFFILLNIFSILLLYRYVQNGESPGDLYSFLLVFLSLIFVIGIPLDFIKKSKGEIPYISSTILISHGIFSYMYPDPDFTTTIPLFWIVAGVFILDIGIRWFGDIEKKQSVLLGIGIYLLFMFLYWFMDGTGNIIHQITILSWAVFGLFLVFTRFVSSERRKKIYSGLLKGTIAAVSVFFVMVAWFLITIENYIEALVELILSGLFVFSLYNYEKDIKSILLYGFPMSILTILTILSLLFF